MEFDEFVLAASTDDLSDEPAARDHADAVEFRLDLAPEPREALRTYDGELPLIATNRVENEGGEAPDTPQRLEVLVEAAEHPLVEAVDVELAALEDGDAERVVEAARANRAAVVVSAHDFDGTPDRETMRASLDRACEYGDVGKLAVTATAPEDVLDLLAVTRAVTVDGGAVATMAMGETGRHSRVIAPLYGSRIGYAPVDPEDATAPGQYDLETLDGLMGYLGVERRAKE